MKKIVLASIISVLNYGASEAQTPFSTIEFLDVNKISAPFLVHGDMWYDPLHYSTPKCNFPKGTPKGIGGFGAELWMSGHDQDGHLHVAAEFFRQEGDDYWPGPLTSSDHLTYSASYDWAKIWKINRSDIEFFLSQSTHTLSNTPPVILTWPGKGSSHARGNNGVVLTVSSDMAPFVDVNANGIYEPLLGDYPDIKGDQALWWVMTDNGPVHTQTNGQPLKVEIHAMSYAYSRGTLLDNVVYCDYNIINRSVNDYHDFRLGIRGDINVGDMEDDYTGFDSSWRLAVVYNAIHDDGAFDAHPPESYGTAMPVVGVTFVSLPGDGAPGYIPAGSFGSIFNDISPIGYPVIDTEYDHYLRARWKDGRHFTNDFVGAGAPAYGRGPGSWTNYHFPGDPGDDNAWSQCSSFSNNGYDPWFIMASSDFNLASGSSRHIVLALVVTDTSQQNYCGGYQFSFANIKTVADTAWNIYKNPPPPKTTSVATLTSNDLNVYPNPVKDILHIATASAQGNEHISVTNVLGQDMLLSYSQTGKEIAVDVSILTPGIYNLAWQLDNHVIRKTFVKQ